jgi:hypothetical protein
MKINDIKVNCQAVHTQAGEEKKATLERETLRAGRKPLPVDSDSSGECGGEACDEGCVWEGKEIVDEKR